MNCADSSGVLGQCPSVNWTDPRLNKTEKTLLNVNEKAPLVNSTVDRVF